MSLSAVPFNLKLLFLSPENTKLLGKISVLDIFEGASSQGGGGGSKNFHPEGLFSIDIFGKVGDEKRNRQFGYIDLGIDIFHPLIYKKLLELKELYGQIMAGSTYAIFDATRKDFVPSTPTEGRTGFQFFIDHFDQLQFETRPSTARDFSIRLVNMYRAQRLNKLLVMPAGLRDFVILPNGKPEEDEINSLYRAVLSMANVIGAYGKFKDASQVDATRYSLQKAVFNIYAYIVNLLEGKGKLVQGWWTSRNVFNSTRNVITSNVPRSRVLGDEFSVSPNHTVAGLYQMASACMPLTIFLLRGFLANTFTGVNAPAVLSDPKTLARVVVPIPSDEYDELMTPEGIEQTIGRFETEALRHDPVMVHGKALMLLYNDGKVVRTLKGIEELPEGFDRQYVSPITLAELLYLALFEKMRDIPVLFTRYPITGYGSIYPSMVYLKTTTRAQSLTILGEDWRPTQVVANEFPIRGVSFVNSMSAAVSHLARLDADHDGDMCSLTPEFTDDAQNEIKRVLADKNYYVGVDGRMVFSAENDVSRLVFAELTS